MKKIAHTLLYMEKDEKDRLMAKNCLNTLKPYNNEDVLIVYNQGKLTNNELKEFLSSFSIPFVVIGNGTNVGIPLGRQSCFEYIWKHLPEVNYISEIHLDMLFTDNWINTIIEYLNESDEPILSPGIVTQLGDICPQYRGQKCVELPANANEIIQVVESLEEDKLYEGFVHPVIHKNSILKKIGGYDIRFLKGMQGYEDDSLLLGYRYYMGDSWRPKVYMKSVVYHAGLVQRMKLDNIPEEFRKNLQGLIKQYGLKGLFTLAEIHQNKEFEKTALYYLNKYNTEGI